MPKPKSLVHPPWCRRVLAVAKWRARLQRVMRIGFRSRKQCQQTSRDSVSPPLDIVSPLPDGAPHRPLPFRRRLALPRSMWWCGHSSLAGCSSLTRQGWRSFPQLGTPPPTSSSEALATGHRCTSCPLRHL